ncbi:MAG TPA: DNA polymerase III subunit beta [Acidimicrobiia bacterium]
MRIRADRDDLADAFTRASRAVAQRTALPVLQGVLCEAQGSRLTVTGTDLEMTVRTSVDVEVLQEGKVVIPGRLLTEAVRKLPVGPVTIGAEDGEVEIVGKGPRFTLRPLALEDFPTLDDAPAGGVEVDGDELAQAIGQVAVAASGDSARPILTGVLFEPTDGGVRLVATDSYRLAVRDLAGVGVESQGLVPARGLRELPRAIGAAKVTVGILDREAVFSSDRGTLRIRLIEGKFPPYRSLLPENYPGQVIIGKDEVLDALGRVSLVAEDHIPVRMKLTDGGVEVNVTRQDVGGEAEHLDGQFTGPEEVLIAFNPRYLADGVAAVPGDKVRVRVIDGLKPAVIDGEGDEGFLYLLMPVRV